MKDKGEKNISLTGRFVWTYALLAACLIFSFSVILYSFLTRTFLEELRLRAQRVAEVSAVQVDIAQHETLVDESQHNSPEYAEIQSTLQTIVSYNPQVDGIYTLRWTDDPNVLAFVIDTYTGEDRNGDGQIAENEIPAEIGEEYDITDFPEMHVALYGAPSADRGVTEDKWGQWISGYAPLRDADGVVVGIIGADIAAHYYWNGIQLIKVVIFFLIVLALLFSVLCGILGNLIFERFSRRLSDLEVAETKTEFVSLVSHQLRSPLTAVSWQLESLLEARMPQKQKVVLVEVQKRLKEMSKLVGDILNTSRIETGRMKITKKPVQLGRLTQDVIQEMEGEAARVGCKVYWKKPSRLPAVVTDVELIRQVVQNFISNALRYSLPGACRIEVVTEAIGGAVRLSVTDHGIGVPDAAREKIFIKGFRADNAVRANSEGAGLGLYLSKRIIDALGGKIGFNSEEGKGSTFWFKLPV